MKIRLRLSIWLIAIMAVVVIGITIFLLRQTAAISYFLNVRSLGLLTAQRVELWKGREDGYIRTLHTLANIMGDYESIQAEERRDRYDDMLKAALETEPQMVALYTVWKPNAIDNMDSRYIGRTGSSPNGQYAIAYFKETNKITGRTSGDINNVIAHITGPNARKDRVDNPTILKIKGKNTYITKISVPIINNHTNKVVGGLGCFLAIDTIQYILENTMKTNNEIAIMAMYSGNGTVLAHYKPERIGKRMLDIDAELGDSRKELFRATQTGKPYMNILHEPAFDEKIILIMKPFQIGNSGHNWSMLIGVPESFILKEVNSITGFTVTLIVIAILVMAVIIFAVIGIIIKPIVRITDTFKDISEGEGDLTRLIPEQGNDEISDMSRYFNLTLKKIKNLIIIIKQQSAILSDRGNELSVSMNQTAAVITQIITELKIIKSRLAEQNLSTDQTAALMEQIIGSIDKLKKHAEQKAANAAKPHSVIKKNISNAIKGHRDSDKQVPEVVSHLNEITRQINNESAEIQSGSKEAALENRYLKLLNEEISAGINEMAAGADQINTAVTRVNEISEKNKKNIDLMVQGVSMFKAA